MHIHIISRDYKSDRILSRLAQILAAQRGFTIADVPNAEADINYFFPYLEYDKSRDFNATKTAGWFTHKDTNRKEKVPMWEMAAKAVDLRLTSAAMYQEQLEKFGPTSLVTVPLDREKFSPTKKEPRKRLVVGTSGYVYPEGRKGEQLITRLFHDHDLDLDLVASGRGWPIPTNEFTWDNIQEFYQGLDIYLCTSLVEGIGYGPIEAMACGVPVVIPTGVGIFDELPNLENLHRYEAGNYQDMKRAIKEAWDRLKQGAYNPESLRGGTLKFTNEAWISIHLMAFEEMLYGIPEAGECPKWKKSAGVYYVAYGDPSRDCARRAIKSFKQHMPDIPVALASDNPLNVGEDIFIDNIDEDIGGRSVKTKIYDLTPKDWNYVLYLDADTEITADISFLFQALEDGWEAVWCTNPGKYSILSYAKRPDCEEEFKLTLDKVSAANGSEILQLNGGVFAFRRSERTAAFFRAWHNEWQRYGARDQMALHRVLYDNPIRLLVLGVEWNTSTRYIEAERTAGILHYQMSARRWRGPINGRLDSQEAWSKVEV